LLRQFKESKAAAWSSNMLAKQSHWGKLHDKLHENMHEFNKCLADDPSFPKFGLVCNAVIDRHVDSQTDTQTDTQTHRQTHRRRPSR